jgi:flap endonuclease-1
VAVEPETIHLDAVLESLGVTREQLVDMAILIGTDFNNGVKGIGQKKGLKLIKEYGTIEKVIEAKGLELPESEYSVVRSIFLEPDVDDDYSLEMPAIDENGVLDYLVNDFRFSDRRVENALSRYRMQREKMAQKTLFDF